MSKQLRVRYTFRGIIQGVGFRPTVYRCAVSLGLTGIVRNERSVVVAEVQGDRNSVETFPKRLVDMLPAAAILDSMRSESVDIASEQDFRIAESRATSYSFPPIPPDLAMCPECRTELYSSDNRRYMFPFITCTQCGPRYSIVEDTPFDRETTSMADFPQCPDCLQEYTNPLDRRFHSQTNCCSVCGPQLVLTDPSGAKISGDPIAASIQALAQGKIVAVQGIGGFHLAARPDLESTVMRLRADKDRERKPFALMVRDLDEARRLCRLPQDIRLLNSPQSPIMIFPLNSDAPEYLTNVSDTSTLGIMLPYTPLHDLFFFHPEVEVPFTHLIMTSGNLKGEPIVTDPEVALQKLSSVADLFLYNNRRIVFRTDDSIVREQEGRVTLLRRSRGYVPRLIRLNQKSDAVILGTGGDLKCAPALSVDSDIYLAPFLGDLENPSTNKDFEKQIEKILSLYDVQPRILVHDLHPGYQSTRWALRSNIETKIAVQHHHAHLLSVMAEYNLQETIGLSFDGTGYGTDGTIWGGEFLHATRGSFSRLGCFRPFRLPGGEAAVLNPPRIAVALLHESLSNSELEKVFCHGLGIDLQALETLLTMLSSRVNCPVTSSLGRIFDAAAALLGLVQITSYESEGPIRLEGIAAAAFFEAAKAPPPIPLPCTAGSDGVFYLDPVPLLLALVQKKENPTGDLALLFHASIAAAAVEGACRMRQSTGINTLALSGGVFQNMLLLNLMLPQLERESFTVFTNQQLPPGDGGIAAGQVYFRA